MGVQGLTTYVEKNRCFLHDVQLRSTMLVVDGCSLYYQLYFTSGLDQEHGGDYDSFTQLIERFFHCLDVCAIRPFVVLDGGMDPSNKKFATLKSRAQSKIKDANSLSRGSYGSVLPILVRDVFVQVVSRLQVPLIQCAVEADWEIACLANQKSCPVLSNDSDFYIFDLKAGYFPMSHFQWSNVHEARKTSESSYIPARRFTVNKFCAAFNHMNKRLLPLFAVITGNDYVGVPGLESFFTGADLNRAGRNPAGRIESLLWWLAGFSGPEQALGEVVRLVGGRDGTRERLLYAMRDYQLSHGSLASYFTDGILGRSGMPEPLSSLPEWVLLALCRCQLGPLALDVLLLQRAMLPTQVENCRLPSGHAGTRAIRQVLYSLLLDWKRRQGLTSVAQGRRDPYLVEEFDRQDLQLRRYAIQAVPTGLVKQLPLENMNVHSLHLRLQLLVETLGVTPTVVMAVPPDFRLLLCVTAYWLRSCVPKPSLLHLQCLLLGLVHGELCKRKNIQLVTCAATTAVCDRLCRLRIFQHERRGLDLEAVHNFSQWQSCLWSGLNLNQSLCCPLPEPDCTWAYSGTFIHRILREVRGGVAPEGLLAGAPGTEKLYRDLLQATMCSVGADFFLPASAKKKRGKRQLQQRQRSRRYPAGSAHSGQVAGDQDLANRFALLTCEGGY